MNKLVKTVFTLSLFFCLAAPLQAETLKLLTYHNHPPFITEPGKGLSYELAENLTQASQGKYEFEVVVLPRNRLNLYIQDWIKGDCPQQTCKQDWLIPWVNPKWGFIKGSSDPYLWKKLLSDANVIVTRADSDIRYQDPNSLEGKRFAGIRGHRYLGIDDLVASGRIIRIDGDHERDNLTKLLYGRVDATLLPSSTMGYYLTQDSALSSKADEFHLSDIKQQVYQRYLMLPGSRKDLAAWLDKVPKLYQFDSNL